MMSRPLRLLVLEDDPLDAEIMLREVRAAGFELQTTVVQNEQEYVAALDPALDIILADYRLPGFDGLRALDLLGQRGLDVPFIIVSGAIGEEVAVEAMRCGAADYILKDRPGRLGRAIVRAVEARRLREAKRRMERDRDRLAMAVEQSSEMTLITDVEGRIDYVNPAFERITGYARDEVIGQNPRILKSGLQDDAFYKQLWETITAGRPWTGQLTNRRKDGSLFEEFATISPVFDEKNRIIHFVAVKRDITQERLLAEQLHQSQKMESIGRLAGGVAHDFSNCMQAILGLTELLLEGPSDPVESVEALTDIRKAAEQGAALTRQLLAFSRKQKFEPASVAINELVDTQRKILDRLLGERIQLDLHLPADVWKVKGDNGQIQQVVMNLALNGRDAMPQGGRLAISTENVEFTASDVGPGREGHPGRFVCLTVTDHGTGMDAATVKRIFEPFFTTKGKDRGTGLGLSVVHGIVNQHGGWIEVHSSPGCGSAFHVFIPAICDAEGNKLEVARPSPPRGDGKRILLVEDDPSVRAIMSRILRHHGYVVLESVGVADAAKLFTRESGRFDAILSDIGLRDGNGVELVTGLVSRRPSLSVVLVSGYSDPETRWPVIHGRDWLLVPKPVSATKLLTALAEVFSRG